MSRPSTKNFWIGIFIIASISIMIAALLLLKPRIGDGQGKLFVRLSSLDKINVGTRVTFAGMSVGQVSAINVLKDARAQKTDPTGRFYFYELQLQIDSHVQVYSSDEIGLQTAGLFGEKFIAITPRAIIAGSEMPHLLSNTTDPIYAVTSDPIEEALGQIYQLSDKLEQMLDRTLDLMQTNQGDITATIKSAKQTFEAINQFVVQANDMQLVESVKNVGDTVSSTLQRVEQGLQKIEQLQTVEHFTQLLANCDQITAAINQPEQLQQIVTQVQALCKGLNYVQEKLAHTDFDFATLLDNVMVAAVNAKNMSEELKQISHAFIVGEGSLGKLVQKDDLYLQGMVVLSKVETLMNDLNQYGLLFSSNRNWQKQRTVRMAQLGKIKSPVQMVTFFEQELDQISTALSRMSQAAKETQQEANTSIQQQELFKSSFKEVLQKMDNVQDMIKLYNDYLYSSKKIEPITTGK